MTTLDRYILRGLTVNYLIAIAVMMSIYVVLDLFFNMDEFTENAVGAAAVLGDVGSFYGNRIFLYFAQLSGVITLFACLVTLSRMRRLNELTAVLASGVSLYRVAAPVIAFAVLTTAVWYADTEIVIPSIAHKLARRHDDAQGRRTFEVDFLQDRHNALVSARQFSPADEMLKRMLIVKRAPDGSLESIIEAEQAFWETSPQAPTAGRWRLERGIERPLRLAAGAGLELEADTDRILVTTYDSDLDPRTIEARQSAGWTKFLSSARLAQLSEQLDGEARRAVRQAKHVRFTTPLVNVLMLLLGLPFILDRMPGSLLVDGGKALLACGLCFLMTFVVQNLSVGTSFSALPAWLPIIVFAPVAAALMDRLRT